MRYSLTKLPCDSLASASWVTIMINLTLAVWVFSLFFLSHTLGGRGLKANHSLHSVHTLDPEISPHLHLGTESQAISHERFQGSKKEIRSKSTELKVLSSQHTIHWCRIQKFKSKTYEDFWDNRSIALHLNCRAPCDNRVHMFIKPLHLKKAWGCGLEIEYLTNMNKAISVWSLARQKNEQKKTKANWIHNASPWYYCASSSLLQTLLLHTTYFASPILTYNKCSFTCHLRWLHPAHRNSGIHRKSSALPSAGLLSFIIHPNSANMQWAR